MEETRYQEKKRSKNERKAVRGKEGEERTRKVDRGRQTRNKGGERGEKEIAIFVYVYIYIYIYTM